MNSRRLNAVAALVALSSFAFPVSAIDKSGVGKIEFEFNCVGWHGDNGKGGLFVDYLNRLQAK
jgi:hypothetical protein